MASDKVRGGLALIDSELVSLGKMLEGYAAVEAADGCNCAYVMSRRAAERAEIRNNIDTLGVNFAESVDKLTADFAESKAKLDAELKDKQAENNRDWAGKMSEFRKQIAEMYKDDKAERDALIEINKDHVAKILAIYEKPPGVFAREGARAVGAFTHMTVLEQHRMQQRGGDY